MTETSPSCTLQDPAEWRKYAGFIGRLIPNIQARLVLDDGTDAAVGEPGEVWVKGPNVMKVCPCFFFTLMSRSIPFSRHLREFVRGTSTILKRRGMRSLPTDGLKRGM